MVISFPGLMPAAVTVMVVQSASFATWAALRSAPTLGKIAQK
jgi:hypothetical protein